MAIYHFSGTIISRSQGRSAVACAAYRSAEKLQDHQYDRVHDYTQKQDVAYKEILLPENAPQWMGDREKLWNAVERSEKRKDAQLAREFNFALPRELTLEQNTVLAREFVQQAFVNKGMVADLCIHNEKTSEGDLQHAHVMLTTREVNEMGFCKKVRAWNAKEQLIEWRERLADVSNQHLALHDHDVRIDHRSFKDQAIDLEPQYKIGASVAKDRMVRFHDHERIARENGERILADPNIALDAITRQQSTFTHQDLARFIHRHTADDAQFQAVYEHVKTHESIVYLGQDDLRRERFTTKEILTLEEKMLVQAVELKDRFAHSVREEHQVAALHSRTLSNEQQNAFEHLMGEGDLKAVIGFAGTGKSYLLGAAREAWEREGYNVLGATLSGIAAESLEGSSGILSRTIASRMYYWNKGEEALTNKDILVIDEAGMIGSRQMGRLLDEAHTHGAKVVLVGDTQQLQAIEAGAAFRAIAEQVHYVELTDIRRQREAWQQDATREFAEGKIDVALSRYNNKDHVHAFDTREVAMKEMVSLWNDVRINEPDKTQIMLAYTRADVGELNEMARELRCENGELGEEHVFQTSRGEKGFSEDDRIYFLKNDRSLGVLNGSLGTIKEIDGHKLVVRLDGQENDQYRDITVDVDRYQHIDHGYAATIHKAQGVTVDRSYILASKYLDAHATYVGLSRHRESVDLFWSKDEFSNEHDLAKRLGRDRAKDVTQDYIADKEIEPQQSKEMSYQEFYLTDEEMKELDDMEKRVGLTQDGLDEFKDSFYKDHPDLVHEADQEINAYLEKATDKKQLDENEPDKNQMIYEMDKKYDHFDIDHMIDEKKIAKTEPTIKQEKQREIELDLEL